MRDNNVLTDMMDPGSGVNVDPNQISPSFAVPQPSDPTGHAPANSDADAESDSDYKEHKDRKGRTIWSDTPTFEDQYKRFPETTRLVGPIVAVYDAANPEELAEINYLFAKQQPENAPSIIMASRKENFHEGKWLMLLEYFRVEYKQLITTS
jgi:hypothetical protein